MVTTREAVHKYRLLSNHIIDRRERQKHNLLRSNWQKSFSLRYTNHRTSFHLRNYKCVTELPNGYWRIKDLNNDANIVDKLWEGINLMLL